MALVPACGAVFCHLTITLHDAHGYRSRAVHPDRGGAGFEDGLLVDHGTSVRAGGHGGGGVRGGCAEIQGDYHASPVWADASLRIRAFFGFFFLIFGVGKNRSGRSRRTSAAKADCLTGVYGTAQAVPFHKTLRQNPTARVLLPPSCCVVLTKCVLCVDGLKEGRRLLRAQRLRTHARWQVPDVSAPR